MTDDPVATMMVMTPVGRLTFVAEPMEHGATLVLKGTHVQGADPNRVGAANLLVVAQALMKEMGVDGLEVEGAIRTTGSNPGHRPRVFRFTRRIRSSPASG